MEWWDIKMTDQLKQTTAPPKLSRHVPLTGSERVRRTRERKRRDIVFLGIEMLPSERNALIRIGLLNQAGRDSKKAIRKALYRFFERHLDPETPPPSSLIGSWHSNGT
jgi:hypothetical protein